MEEVLIPEARESVLRPDRFEVVVALLKVLESAVRYEFMLDIVGYRFELDISLAASLVAVDDRLRVGFGLCRGEAGRGLS